MEFQDVVIAASFLVTNSDFLLTENKKHFTRIPALKEGFLRQESLERNLQWIEFLFTFEKNDKRGFRILPEVAIGFSKRASESN